MLAIWCLNNSATSCKDLFCLAKCCNQSINLFWQIIQVNAGAHGRRNIKQTMERLGAVVTCAHRNTFAIQYRRYIVRMNVLKGERDRATPILRLGRPIDRYAAGLG